MFRLATARQPDAKELAELTGAFKDLPGPLHRASAGAAKKLIAIGETKPDPRIDAGELAAWTMIGNVILNLDEVMTKG